MADFTLTPSMALPVPIVGQDPGPDYAININNCLTILDGHDHSPGYGVAITPAGLNINAALTFANNDATNLRTLRFQPQSVAPAGPLDLGCLTEIGVDLYYIDGSGNLVRITQSGGVAGSPGSIANLTSPASASYVLASKSFVFESDANVAANVDGASFILRNITPNSTNAITLSPPAALSSNYTITLPSLPVAQSFLTIDNSGNMAAPIAFSQGITNSNIANGTISNAKLATVRYDFSNLASASSSSTSPTSVGLSVLLTGLTPGRPVAFGLKSIDGATGYINLQANSATPQDLSLFGNVIIQRDGGAPNLYIGQFGANLTSNAGGVETAKNLTYAPSIINGVDFSTSATSHTYSVFINILSTGGTGVARVISLQNVCLYAYEL